MLVAPYYGKNHHIYFDRFFTSFHLSDELLKNGTYSCGTVMLNRKGLPSAAKITKMARGETRFYQKDSILLTTWKDKRQVNILSTNANANIEETSNKPDSVSLYNQFMGGVDKNNQLCTYYRVGRGSHKWWRYIFWFGFNLAMTNAWILWKESAHDQHLQNLDHLKFCTMLAEELRAGFSSRKLKTGRPSRNASLPIKSAHGHILVKIIGRPKICRQCVIRGRREGRKRETSFQCKACQVPMCKVPCFAEFHRFNEEWHVRYPSNE